MNESHIKELFKDKIYNPDLRSDTFFLYQDGEFLAILDIYDLVNIYGKYKVDHIENKPSNLPIIKTGQSLQVHVISPDILWYDKTKEIEYVGFTDTSLNKEEIEGFFTFCVGYSVETGYIYVDIRYTEKSDEYEILSDKKAFAGRGYQDIRVKVPGEMIDKLINISREKIVSLYENNIANVEEMT